MNDFIKLPTCGNAYDEKSYFYVRKDCIISFGVNARKIEGFNTENKKVYVSIVGNEYPICVDMTMDEFIELMSK